MLTGAIWAAWHMPILLFADYNNGVSKSYALACFFILVVATSIPMAWIRLRSGSVWPAAIFHASHNLFVQAVFTPITVSTSWISPYAIDEFGFALPIVVMGAAWLFWRRDRALVQPCGDQVRFQS
jgi:membrane protease YdiL (CAAX protease family)